MSTRRSEIGAAVKITGMICLSLLALLIDTVTSLALLFGVAAVALVVSRISPRKFLLWLLVIALAVWGFVVTQALFYQSQPRTVLLEIISPDDPFAGRLTSGLYIYKEGIYHGVTQSLRFLTMITAGLALVWTTSPQKLLKSLRGMKLPARLSFMAAAAIRFVPVIASEIAIVYSAMKTRGFSLVWYKPWNYIRAATKALVPVIFRNLRRGTMLADSVESRGFVFRDGLDGQIRAAAGAADRIMIGTMVLCTCCVVVLKLLELAAVYDVAYFDQLRFLYEFVEFYL